MKINLNGKEYDPKVDRMSFFDVVQAAMTHRGTFKGFNDAFYDQVEFWTVTYSNAAGTRSEGSLRPGERVHLKDGTIINAVITGSA